MSNPNRANQGPPSRNQSFSQERSWGYQQTLPKNLPDRKTSKNPYINGTKSFDLRADGRLCIRCGHLGHIAKDCMDDALTYWEQSYLKEIVFNNNPSQVSFAAAGFGDYDGNASPTGSTIASSNPSAAYTPASSSPATTFASPVNSIIVGTADLVVTQAAESKSVTANLGESSGPNKRAHVEDEIESPQQSSSSRRQEKQPEQRSMPTPVLPQRQNSGQQQQQIPVPQNQFQAPQQFQPQQAAIPMQAPTFQFTAPQAAPAATEEAQEEGSDRPKRKGKKRMGKKVEPEPLVGMFNETLGRFDSPVSIRQVLQNNKVDMTWMDLVAWSPAVCRELKRLCTRVAKKRVPKASQPQDSQSQAQQGSAPQFTFQPMTQIPQPMPAYMMPAQTFQPMMSGGLQQPQTVSSLAAAQADWHTRFLSAMIAMEKAFRFLCTILKPDGTTAVLDKKHTQADQGSDMNVISAGLVRFLALQLHSLEEVGFRGLSMRTADHRETILNH